MSHAQDTGQEVMGRSCQRRILLELGLRHADPCHVAQSPFVILDFGQVQVQIQVRPITTEGLVSYLDSEARRIKELVAIRDAIAPRKAVIIVDGSVSLMPPGEARNIQRNWFNENQNLLRLVTHQMGFVLPNAFLRGFMAAVFYLASPPVPMVTHGSLAEAVAWAIAEARAINGQVSEELLAHGVAAIERARSKAALMAPSSTARTS